MANEEQLAILRQGSEAWNAWRQNYPDNEADLHETDLSKADLSRANLNEADLSRANLTSANLSGAFLYSANLRRANLQRTDLDGAYLNGADLNGAYLSRADLRGANFSGADLCGTDLNEAFLNKTNFSGADLSGANLRFAGLNETFFVNLDLSSCEGLESCVHHGPSVIDHRTLQRSGPLPLAFLRGVGLPDNLIDYLPSLLGQAIQFYSCFISYSSKDQAFAERLHADLQAKGVRCWFAPEDMKIGAKIIDAIDEAIQLRDKVLLVLSEDAIASDWVEGEVTRSLDEERKRKQLVLVPIRIDDTVLKTEEAWAWLLRSQRNIGDFTHWKNHDAYTKGLERLLRDLKV